MQTLKRWSTVGALGALLALGGLGATVVQDQAPPEIDVDKVVAELDLSDEVKAAVVPELNRLNDLLAQTAESGEWSLDIRRGFHEVFSNVFPRLTWEQRRQLHQALWDAGVFGPRGGHMSPYMGMMGQHTMGRDMEFGPGDGCWVGGTVGPGRGVHHGYMHGTPGRGGPGSRG